MQKNIRSTLRIMYHVKKKCRRNLNKEGKIVFGRNEHKNTHNLPFKILTIKLRSPILINFKNKTYFRFEENAVKSNY